MSDTDTSEQKKMQQTIEKQQRDLCDNAALIDALRQTVSSKKVTDEISQTLVTSIKEYIQFTNMFSPSARPFKRSHPD